MEIAIKERVKNVVNGIVPPYFMRAYGRAKRILNPPPSEFELLTDGILFDGDEMLFKALAEKSEVYGEYGCGKSTIWMAMHTQSQVTSVDTSFEWIQKVKDRLIQAGSTASPALLHVDLGDIMDWGHPASYSRRTTFPDYFEAIWQQTRKPDLVLIDGRFRVSCFLTTLIHCAPGTKIIFDDYLNRSCYHIVEEFCPLAAKCGRQGLFIAPQTLDRRAIVRELEKFTYVMD